MTDNNDKIKNLESSLSTVKEDAKEIPNLKSEVEHLKTKEHSFKTRIEDLENSQQNIKETETSLAT